MRDSLATSRSNRWEIPSGGWRIALVVALVAATVGCSYAGSPVRLYGSSRDRARLTGSWSGEYIGAPDHDRSGTISFVLLSEDAEAHGDVIMMANSHTDPYGSYAGDMAPTGLNQRPDRQALTIRFVDIDATTVSGVIDKYWDPDRRTMAQSTFRGTLTDDVIEGTFVTEYADGAPSTSGHWKVRRDRSR